MSDGMSQAADGIHAARERAEELHGHLSDDALRREITAHVEQRDQIHAVIRELEAMRDRHADAVDTLVTEYLRRSRR